MPPRNHVLVIGLSLAVRIEIVCSRVEQVHQWRGERYDGTSTRTGPLESEKKLQTELKDNAKK